MMSYSMSRQPVARAFEPRLCREFSCPLRFAFVGGRVGGQRSIGSRERRSRVGLFPAQAFALRAIHATSVARNARASSQLLLY